MTERLQINADLTDHPELYSKVKKIVKKLDTDKSKFTRLALRKLISEIEKGEKTKQEIEKELV